VVGDGKAGVKREEGGVRVQLMRLYIVTPEAGAAAVVLRPRIRLTQMKVHNKVAATSGDGRADEGGAGVGGEAQAGVGEGGGRDCVWEALEELTLPPNALVVVHFPYGYTCCSGSYAPLTVVPPHMCKDVGAGGNAEAVEEKGEGDSGFVGELLSGSLVVFPS
jgi:hypothetical protein